jgi:hypothetical protein
MALLGVFGFFIWQLFNKIEDPPSPSRAGVGMGGTFNLAATNPHPGFRTPWRHHDFDIRFQSTGEKKARSGSLDKATGRGTIQAIMRIATRCKLLGHPAAALAVASGKA